MCVPSCCSARQQCHYWTTFGSDAFTDASFSTIWMGILWGLLSRQGWFMAVIHISKRGGRKKRQRDKQKTPIHQIHSDIDFLHLHKLSQSHIHSVSVDVWPWECVWESLWCSQKRPILLTACPALSVVHNWFPPHSNLVIYPVSLHKSSTQWAKQTHGNKSLGARMTDQ